MTKASNKSKPAGQFKQLPKLTRKQAAFVKELVNNPKQSATQAAIKTYGKPDKPVTYMSARQIATDNLKKPSIISHLDNYSDIVENNITNTAIEWSNEDNVKKRALSMQMNTYIHDKIHGKATIRTENTNLNINIEQLLNDM